MTSPACCIAEISIVRFASCCGARLARAAQAAVSFLLDVEFCANAVPASAARHNKPLVKLFML